MTKKVRFKKCERFKTKLKEQQKVGNRNGGSLAGWLAYLLLNPVTLDSIPGDPKVFGEIADAAMVN